MKPAEWRELSDDDLKQKIVELGEELFNLRVQLSLGVAKKPSRIEHAKRERARALTVLKERELGARRTG